MHSYSISELKIGDVIESVFDKYSGPSKVASLSFKVIFSLNKLLIFVFLVTIQNCGDQETFIKAIYDF